MGNIDVEIYISQLINFFENNPNDLMDLIGDLQKEEFYNKLRERCDENFNKGEEIILTKTQIIEVVLELKFKELPVKDLKIDMVIEVDKLFEKTKFGLIGLN